MYHTVQSIQSVHYSRPPVQPSFSPSHSSENGSAWSPAQLTDYSPSQVSGDLRNCATYNYTQSALLAYPESSQRTFLSESSLTNACHIGHTLDSTSSTQCSQQVSPPTAFDERDGNMHRYYRAEENSIYPVTQQEPSPYDIFDHPLHEYGIQPLSNPRRDDGSPTSAEIDNMLQVFSVQPHAYSDVTAPPLPPRSINASPSTLTFQLGPHSLDQVEDPEPPSSTRLSDHSTSDGADDESEETLWEGTAGSPPHTTPPGPHSLTPSPLGSQLLMKLDGKRSTKKPTQPDAGKRSKMHQCKICEKWFPRPSGLATHMNSHSGLRPFSCPLPTCNKSFAVRSNAKRHLRTHGIIPSPESHKSIKYTVGFDTPLVTDVHEPSEPPTMLRWVPQSLTSWTNANWPKSTDSESDGEDCYPILPVPLPPVTHSPKSWDPNCRYEERAAYDEAASQPYHPRHWRGLPGPAFT